MIDAARDKKATGVVVLDLKKAGAFTDYFVICSATNPRQVQAIADAVEDALKAQKQRPSLVEGYARAEWVLIDYFDFVVHVFSKHARDFYGLDRLWGSATRHRVPRRGVVFRTPFFQPSSSRRARPAANACNSRWTDRYARCAGPAFGTSGPLTSASTHRCDLSWAAAAAPYDGRMKDIIHALKYDRRRSISPRLGALMRECGVELLRDADCVVPVPLHPRREYRRGFNQAHDLAMHLGLPVLPLLKRVVFTRSQIDLPKHERHRNVRDAFAFDRIPDPGSLIPAWSS